MLKANISFPTRYRFGWGRRAEIGAEAKLLGMARPLVVTDAGVAAQPWFDASGWKVFDGVRGNPTEAQVRAGVEAYDGCDGIIAIGGGSAMDAAKVIALLAGHGGSAAEYAVGRAKARQIRAEKIAPLVAVPTTSGTGSEVSTGAVVTDHAAKVKRTILHAGLMPKAVVADPEVTVGMPAAVTAATGMDAMTHAIEALCAPGYHPMCDGIARETIRMIFEWLPRAVEEPRNQEARGHMMMAASMAAVAFQKGLGLVHAMAHPLGAVSNVHHGLANAVLLPHVLELNRIDGDLIGRVKGLARAIGIPETLAIDADVDELARLAMEEKLYLATNPRVVTVDEIAGIYRAVLTSAAS